MEESLLVSTISCYGAMIGVAFDSRFHHVKKVRHVILVHMPLVPQAGAPNLVPARIEAKP